MPTVRRNVQNVDGLCRCDDIIHRRRADARGITAPHRRAIPRRGTLRDLLAWAGDTVHLADLRASAASLEQTFLSIAGTADLSRPGATADSAAA